jgi:hypothetical protein
VKLIQILDRLYDNDGKSYTKSIFDQIWSELTDTFRGVTAFLRSPAVGLWEDQSGKVQRDDVVLLEVMASDLDRTWWHSYQRDFEQRFAQQSIAVRAIDVEIAASARIRKTPTTGGRVSLENLLYMAGSPIPDRFAALLRRLVALGCCRNSGRCDIWDLMRANACYRLP